MKLEIYTQILSKVVRFDKLTLFVHERPDFDALGSAFGFKEFINTYFPKKKVYVVGTHELNPKYGSVLFPFEKEPLSDEFLKDSLAILFDIANADRVLTRKHVMAKEIMRIDHHIKIEQIGSVEWIDPTFSSTAEMVAWLIHESKFRITPQIAKYLYAGIVTDTGRFLYQSTLPSTFLITSMLVKTGFNRLEVHDAIYLRSLKEHKLMSYVINRIKVTPQGCAYAILPKNIHKRFDIHDAPLSMVHALNNIKGVHIWTTIYYDNFSHGWKGSIRSRYFAINQIASQFNGGGHKLASGFSLKHKKDFRKLIAVIDDYLESVIFPEEEESFI